VFPRVTARGAVKIRHKEIRRIGVRRRARRSAFAIREE
jgi:hypothetical protein